MAAKNGRNISLTDEQHALIERLVESGRYASASEVVRDGLRLLQREEQARLLEKWLVEGLSAEEQAGLPSGVLDSARRTTQAKIREGLEEARRGDLIDGHDFFARWQERLESEVPSQPSARAVKRRR